VITMPAMLAMIAMIGMRMGVMLMMRVCHEGILVLYAAALSTSTVTWDSDLKRPSVAR
jgi:hypothetical protein